MTVHPSDYRPYIIFGTTQRCNYRCRMCFWSRPEIAENLKETDPTMSLELFGRALEEAAPYCSSVCLAPAGEFLTDPFLDERLAILGDTLRRHPELMLYQTTNASLLTPDRLSFLKGTTKAGFTISIDSVDALTYASIRRPGTLSKVMSNIRSLRWELRAMGLRDVHLRLNMVLMKRNIFSLPDVLRFASEIHAAVYVDHPQGFGPDDLHKESLFAYPAFANDFLAKCQELAAVLDVAFERPPAFAITPEEVEKYYRAGKDGNLHCYQLNKAGPIQISPAGDVQVCCQNLTFGNLYEQSFKEIFFSPLYDKYRDAIARGTPPPPCDTCRHLYRSAPFLYDSSVYGLNMPLESRNLEVEPDFEKEGFFDWLDELSEKQLRGQLRQNYLYQAHTLSSKALPGELVSFKRRKRMHELIAGFIAERTKVVVYPAGRQASWILEHTPLSRADIIGFSDRNPAMGAKPFHGYEVVVPDKIADLSPDVVLIASDLNRDNILNELAHLETRGIKLVAI